MDPGFRGHRARLPEDVQGQDCPHCAGISHAGPVLRHLHPGPPLPLLLRPAGLRHVPPQGGPGYPRLLLSLHGNTVQQVQ